MVYLMWYVVLLSLMAVSGYGVSDGGTWLWCI